MGDGFLADADAEPLGDGFPADGSGDGTLGDAPDGSSSDGSTSDGGGVLEASADGGCPPALTDCGGVCVDTSSNNSNCGFCGNVCPLGLTCYQGGCGQLVGGFIYIGSDFTGTPSFQQVRILKDAVDLAASNVILTYAANAQAAAVAQVQSNILAGPSYTFKTISTPSLPPDFSVQNYGVLLVYDEPTAAAGTLATLGASWSSQLLTFVSTGGIVIVLDGGTGVGEMPAFVNGVDLLPCSSCTSHAPLASGTSLTLTAKNDAVGIGVFTPLSIGSNAVTFATAPQGAGVAYVVTVTSDAGVGAPVVVHATY
jgi:hypothetical protein